MIKTYLMYPNKKGARFDQEYYRKKHLPLVKARLGAALKRMSIDRGLVGAAHDVPAPYIVVAQMCFESIAAFEQAFLPHAQEIFSDLPNFTDVQPLPMIGEVVVE